MKKYWLIIICITMFSLITLGVVTNFAPIINFDHQIIQNISKFHSAELLTFFTVLTQAFNPEIFIFWFIPIALFLWYKNQKSVVTWFSITIVLSITVKTIIKYLIERPRPEMHLLPTHTPSFPSGHSTISAVFFIGLWLLFSNQIKHKFTRVIFKIMCALGLILVPFSRIFLQMHFPSDVIAGILWGTLVLLITLNLRGKTNQVSSSK